MKIAIIGAGGVGGYFGAKLAQAGNDVTFLARGKHLKAIEENGLIVKSIQGDFKVENVQATDNIQSITPPALVIVAVKAWQIKELRDKLKEIIIPETMILPLQNGVLAAEELSEVLGKELVLGGLCRILSKIEGPGVIRHFGIAPAIIFGEFGKSSSERTTALLNVFSKAGIDAELSTDIEAELWKKFIAICAGALLAVTKTTYGECRDLPETRKMMTDLLTEIYVLSKAKGVQIETDFVNKAVAFIDKFPADSTSSLTRDIWDGKPSEIEYQNGTVVKLAEKYGVETPINRFVYHSILPMEIKARKAK